jgi:hypothetical protein
MIVVITFLTLFLHPRRRHLDAARQAAGLPGSVLAPTAVAGSTMLITPSLPELEYPHIPLSNTLFAGPVLTPEPPLSAEDHPELAAFMDGNRIVHINMGTMFEYTEADVLTIVDAIVDARTRLQDRGGFSVLWKLPGLKTFETLLENRLGEHRKYVHVEEWIAPRSLAVLQHPNLVVSVHHAGASA